MDSSQSIAKRAGIENSVYNLPAHRVLLALIEHAPSPDTMAEEFLRELGKCGVSGMVDLIENINAGKGMLSPDTWAVTAQQQLQEPGRDLARLTDMASYYLSHLIIAFRNPGGKKTPQDSVSPTPNVRFVEEIDELLDQATTGRSQSALKDLITLRDGPRCLFTGLSFVPPKPVIPRCAHIIPSSVHSKADFVQQHISHPCNALNLERNTHEAMYKNMAWGIEARLSDNNWRYYYRVVREDLVSPLTNLEDGDEVAFGKGIGGGRIALPDPNICNLHLTIARFSYASGASEIFDQYLDDEDEDGFQVPVYFGGPFVPDDVIMCKLEVLAC